MRKNGQTFNCIVCSAPFYVAGYRVKNARACSDICNRKARFSIILDQYGKLAAGLYADGESVLHIATELHLNHRTVMRILRELNVPMRDRSTATMQSWQNGRVSRGNVRATHREVRARGACEECGNKDILEIHHLDGQGSRLPNALRNEAISNLRLLCRDCHIEAEKQRHAG